MFLVRSTVSPADACILSTDTETDQMALVTSNFYVIRTEKLDAFRRFFDFFLFATFLIEDLENQLYCFVFFCGARNAA
ncbi:hypothetical protein DAPPUDRAFT_261115 [Daphnia pulex]|uniref:Uncharacterized protein n=1 Tax=Daphnia pulex TaxID=6669 RepID=E9HKJ9_DAPPU|nr:hypothetical protein DAPPUDRAFT_261115 [Daphnia pulex]|eukprot:EFX67733.1 hypothetical protein DAPPUDRAFT_261115 [Daphnia pulex]